MLGETNDTERNDILFTKTIDEIIDESVFEKNERLEKLSETETKKLTQSSVDILKSESSISEFFKKFSQRLNVIFKDLFNKEDNVLWVDHISNIFSDKDNTLSVGVLLIVCAIVISLLS